MDKGMAIGSDAMKEFKAMNAPLSTRGN